ncbi:hypothetical protein PCH_Pc22g17860 [Penicillium rubens Wisconsin 54-1255]|uniref:Uncharacterized protein n=1 Tax=Penicillium rubens (strain ATCC 28089 / DSM 1075 / NRRL 1951 / Wisconsin 54-1255) TaxID=500485 RepID=B6HTN9_PENRW|nr:hypothetical protein PCH_Pc22g17860 [Penicillium rubens Wisconsin 54-1255]
MALYSVLWVPAMQARSGADDLEFVPQDKALATVGLMHSDLQSDDPETHMVALLPSMESGTNNRTHPALRTPKMEPNTHSVDDRVPGMTFLAPSRLQPPLRGLVPQSMFLVSIFHDPLNATKAPTLTAYPPGSTVFVAGGCCVRLSRAGFGNGAG